MIRRRILASLVALTVLIATVATVNGSLPGAASAAPEAAKPAVAPPALLAIAIGQLTEQDGDSATVDLRATLRGGTAHGTLRFFCPKEGYYNGAVRSLTLENGVIKISGGGGLTKPDGTRRFVRYRAEFSTATNEGAITVTGRGGYQYTMSGRLDPGTVWAGDPRTHSAGTP